jgi:hypothetical protein
MPPVMVFVTSGNFSIVLQLTIKFSLFLTEGGDTISHCLWQNLGLSGPGFLSREGMK